VPQTNSTMALGSARAVHRAPDSEACVQSSACEIQVPGQASSGELIIIPNATQIKMRALVLTTAPPPALKVMKTMSPTGCRARHGI